MNKEQQIAELKKTIELASKQIAELEKPKFEVCRDGFRARLDECESIRESYEGFAKKALIFATAEIAKKVDKIIEPSRFIAQYVFWREPDYVPDFNNRNEKKCIIYFDHSDGIFRYSFSRDMVFSGAVFMPEYVANELCEILNNGEYKLETDK